MMPMKMMMKIIVEIQPFTIDCDVSQDYGLTTYGEACIDSCKQRGFPFTWCHKAKSRNGTFVGISYDDHDAGDDGVDKDDDFVDEDDFTMSTD